MKIKMLIRNGADKFIKDKNGDGCLKWKSTHEIYSLFIETINEKDLIGNTIVHRFAMNGSFMDLEFAIKNGADLTIKK